jgi:hypothetical protein
MRRSFFPLFILFLSNSRWRIARDHFKYGKHNMTPIYSLSAFDRRDMCLDACLDWKRLRRLDCVDRVIVMDRNRAPSVRWGENLGSPRGVATCQPLSHRDFRPTDRYLKCTLFFAILVLFAAIPGFVFSLRLRGFA